MISFLVRDQRNAGKTIVHAKLWHHFQCRGRGSLPEAHLGYEDLHLVQRLDTSMHCHNTDTSVLDDRLYKSVLREESKWHKWKLPVTTQSLVFHTFVSATKLWRFVVDVVA